MHIYFNPLSYTTANAATQQRKLLNPDPYPAFIMSFNTCRPTSRGWVRIASPDPRAPPRMHGNVLATAEDVADVQEGARLLRRIAAARPLADVVDLELKPGAGCSSEDAILEDFRQRAGTVFHASCTCMMGSDPARSVVDPALRVHGLECLRVVDASVFPTVTSGNTNAPTIMVAEKAAELILADA
jgi:choline dehydrogenase